MMSAHLVEEPGHSSKGTIMDETTRRWMLQLLDDEPSFGSASKASVAEASAASAASAAMRSNCHVVTAEPPQVRLQEKHPCPPTTQELADVLDGGHTLPAGGAGQPVRLEEEFPQCQATTQELVKMLDDYDASAAGGAGPPVRLEEEHP